MNPEFLSPDLLVRLVLSIGIIAAGFSLYWLTNRWLVARANGRIQGTDSLQHDGPTLLYFTSPTCAPCKTIQGPAIQQVKQQIGENLHVIEIDASDRPDLAGRWGVLSVPTTYIIDASGHARHVNHGVATADKLFRQINTIIR